MFGLFTKKPKAAQPDASLIVPRIKHTNFLAALHDVGTGVDDTPVTEPLVGDLLVTYAFDLPELFQMVRPLDCAQLGLTHEQLRGIAIDNLKRKIGKLGYLGDPPVLRLVVGNNLEACLLLVDDVWQTVASKIPPEVIVGVPTRDVVLITTTASTKGGMNLIREAVVDAHGKETVHRLTQHLLVRRANKWEVYDGVD